MTEPVQLPTRRDYLIGKGLAQPKTEGKRGGGRFSKKAHEALIEARKNGQQFADDTAA